MVDEMNRQVSWELLDLFQEDKAQEKEERESREEGIDIEQLLSMPKLSITPIGPVSIDNENHPLRSVRFLVGHANFDITSEQLIALNKVEGIEYLRPVSRYRFLVGVALMFDIAKVLEDIEDTFGIKESHPLLEKIEEKLEEKYEDEAWLAYVFPNGRFISKVIKDDADLDKTMQKYTNLQSLSHGYILP